jgi:hypothetical protein
MLSVIRNRILLSLSDWPRWWRQKTPLQRITPLLLVVSYWCVYAFSGVLGTDPVLIGTVCLLLAYAGPQTEEFLHFILPFILSIVIYDSMRHYCQWLRVGEIHVKEGYFFDKILFGIPTAQGVLTPNEWLQKHTHWTLDVITGFFYLSFLGIFTALGIYFRYGLKHPEAAPRANRMMKSFLWLSLISFATYYLFPAAPPWYVAKYGLGPVDPSVPSNAAGCLRFDQLFGIHLFQEMYQKSSNVFGAVPSLHISYPFLAMLFSFELKALRPFCMFYFFTTAFAAVYLNHHYILDILWGATYTLGVYSVLRWRAHRLKRFT